MRALKISMRKLYFINLIAIFELRAHARGRRMIECTWAILKNRFAALKNTMRLKQPKTCGEVIMACGHLHNFIMDNKDDDDDFLTNFGGLEEEDEEQSEEEDERQQHINPIVNNEYLNGVFKTFNSINNIQ